MNTDAFEVTGGVSLNGEIVPQGAKNEALQVLCAVMLTDQTVILSNVPDILDVQRLITLIKGLGVKVMNLSPGTWSFTASDIDLNYFYSTEFRKNASRIRGSVMLIGAMLGRFGNCLLYTSPSPRDKRQSRMPSSA